VRKEILRLPCRAALQDGRAGGISMSLEFLVLFFQEKSTEENFTLTARGFTGHEHYPYFNIINMNGRLYDPVIARFFSPDKYVANSSFTQDFNRYTYARNNPLMYTDPSGEFLWWIPIAAIGISAAIAATSYTIQVAASPGGFQNWSWDQFGFNMMLGIGCGLIAAGVGGAVADVVPITGFLGGFVSGAAGGGVSGVVNGAATGASIWKSALMGAGIGGAIGGLIGGIEAAARGANFWDGSYTFHDYVDGSPILNEKARLEARNEAQKYNTDGRGDTHDISMKTLVKSKFARYENIANFSTKPHEDYGLYNGKYVCPDGKIANGYMRGVVGKTPEIRVAPARLLNMDDFMATTGHEILHAIHFNSYTSLYSTSRATWHLRSEAACSTYSGNVYWNAGNYKLAWYYYARGGYVYPGWQTSLFW